MVGILREPKPGFIPTATYRQVKAATKLLKQRPGAGLHVFSVAQCPFFIVLFGLRVPLSIQRVLSGSDSFALFSFFFGAKAFLSTQATQKGCPFFTHGRWAAELCRLQLRLERCVV